LLTFCIAARWHFFLLYVETFGKNWRWPVRPLLLALSALLTFCIAARWHFFLLYVETFGKNWRWPVRPLL
ncbi:hypothetical protein QWT33_23810, partial [Salmonella enterica subsp. enterica serovar Typhi]